MKYTHAKRWRLAPQLPPSQQSHFRDFHPVMAQVLYNRGFTDGDKARQFLLADTVPHTDVEFAGMAEAVARIRQAIQSRDPILVYGDFDTDGITSTAVLVQTLRVLGAIVEPYIPHRIDDGYGLNSSALMQLSQDGFKVVVTVDCGIRAVQEVADANSMGMDVIITDHHSVGPELPDALAIVNPKQDNCDYPEDMLAGVGVAYHLAVALLNAAKSSEDAKEVGLKPEDLLDLVALGTVADLAPMDRLENRVLVKRGLEVINAARRMGLYALIDQVNLQPGSIKSANIGFGLGPRLNAAGRLESAITAYELLMAEDYNQAMTLANDLNELNIRRQDETRSAQEKARELAVQGLVLDELPLIFAADRGFLSGIVGLVAGRLAEEFYRPAIVVELGTEESRGSCRSIPEFNIVEALDSCADLLLRHGGHAQAAGFSLRNENLEEFRDRMFVMAREALLGQDLRPSLNVDVEVPFEQLSLSLAEELSKLEPVGHKNPQPLLQSNGLRVLSSRRVGRDGAHLKLSLGDAHARIDAIAFRQGETIFDLPRRIDVAYHLEVNEWNGRRRAQLNVRDWRPTI